METKSPDRGVYSDELTVQPNPSAGSIAGRVLAYARQRGIRGTLKALAKTIFYPFVHYNRHLIWDLTLDGNRPPSSWSPKEHLSILGPEDLEKALTPRLREFLGGVAAEHDLKGVRQGDRLLLVTIEGEYAYSAYIYFDTTVETRRQKKIYGEMKETPIIGSCLTAPAFRRRGIHRRVLNDAFRYLRQIGCRRVVLEVLADNEPSNQANERVGMNIRRELTDWTVFRRLVVQRVVEDRRPRWRVFVI